MGDLLGHAVRFGVAGEVDGGGRRHRDDAVAAGSALPTMPMAAALSASHLSAILFPDTLRRLYIARDNDPAGDGAMATLIERANAAGIEAIVLSPIARATSTRISACWAWTPSGSGPGADRATGRRTLHGACGIGRKGMQSGGSAIVGIARIALPYVGEDHAPGLREGDRPANGPDRQWLRPTIFRRRFGPLSIAKQNSRPSPSSAVLRPSASLRVQVRPARRLSSP